MPRAFDLHLHVNDDLAYNHEIVVLDGHDVRHHDVALILRRLLEACERQGSERVVTVGEIARAKAVLAEWEPTADGVSMFNGVHSRTFVKNGHTEPVVAVCDPNGNPTMATAATLGAWTPSE
jgi:hypothetical protein